MIRRTFNVKFKKTKRIKKKMLLPKELTRRKNRNISLFGSNNMTLEKIFHAIKTPFRYARAPLRRRFRKGRPIAVVLGFSPWKAFIHDWLPSHAVIRRDRNIQKFEFYTFIAPKLLSDRKSEVVVWGYKIPAHVERFCKRFRIPITRVEDGFIRSVQLGATKAPPLSLCMDRKGLYFDATRRSSLEDILNTYKFEADKKLRVRARKGIELLLDTRLSKYNVGESVDIESVYGPKTSKRILVIGQVDGDMSIQLGCNKAIRNNDLVWIAATENPGAQIIYKPHPEVLHGTRKDPPQSDPREVSGIAQVLLDDISLADAFETIDHVYTITSLAGFEALIRGLPVTCLGAPFYSGWGLTDDRQKTTRRKRKLLIDDLFAAAYILYPQYYDPYRKTFVEFEDALKLLRLMKDASAKTSSLLANSNSMPPPEKPAITESLTLATSLEKRSEIHLEAIRSFRRLLNVIDPPLQAKNSANSAPKKKITPTVPKKIANKTPAKRVN